MVGADASTSTSFGATFQDLFFRLPPRRQEAKCWPDIAFSRPSVSAYVSLMEKGCLGPPPRPQLHHLLCPPPPQPNLEASQGQEVEGKKTWPESQRSGATRRLCSTLTSPPEGGGRVVKAACGLVGGGGVLFLARTTLRVRSKVLTGSGALRTGALLSCSLPFEAAAPFLFLAFSVFFFFPPFVCSRSLEKRQITKYVR